MGLIIEMFWMIAELLEYLSEKLNITYNEINIISYYVIIPLIWSIMIDIALKTFIVCPILLICYLIIYLINRKNFKRFCDILFYKSQEFIFLFGKNYVLWSVIICVFVPIVITILLLFLI